MIMQSVLMRRSGAVLRILVGKAEKTHYCLERDVFKANFSKYSVQILILRNEFITYEGAARQEELEICVFHSNVGNLSQFYRTF